MAQHDAFLHPKLTRDTQDRYFVRSSILRALTSQLPHFQGTFLDIGCGVQPYRSLITAAPSRVEHYLGMDLEGNPTAGYLKVQPERFWNGLHIPMEDASVDSAMATEVLEHCPDPAMVLSEAFRVLRPGGFLFLTVPFLWPLHDVPHDEYRYTPFAMERLLRNAGFGDVALTPLGGWSASLAQMLALWSVRSPMSPRGRKLSTRLTLPIVAYLLKRDRIPDPMTNPMITGLMGTARKPAA
jgi:SAM-dependent methyltransferase